MSRTRLWIAVAVAFLILVSGFALSAIDSSGDDAYGRLEFLSAPAATPDAPSGPKEPYVYKGRMIAEWFMDMDRANIKFLSNTSARFVAVLWAPYVLMTAIVIGLYGYSLVFMGTKGPLADAIRLAFRLGIVGMILFGGVFVGKITMWAYTAPDLLVQALSGDSTMSAAAMLDEAIGNFFKLKADVDRRIDGMGFRDSFWWSVFELILFLAAAVNIGIAAGNIVMGKFFCTITIAVGPIFFLMYLLPYTRGLIMNWWNEIMYFIVFFLILYFILTLLFVQWDGSITTALDDKDGGAAAFFTFLVIAVTTVFILLQFPMFVRGFVNTWHIDTASLVGAMGKPTVVAGKAVAGQFKKDSIGAKTGVYLAAVLASLYRRARGRPTL